MSAAAWVALGLGVWFLVSFACGVLVGKAMAIYNCPDCGEPLGCGGCDGCFETQARDTEEALA